jgi:protein-S-isoprenylcysteine O-methyltransferase Ste14
MSNCYKICIITVLGFAVIVFFLLFFITAPYGKFSRKGWGLNIRTKWAWMIMEFPSPVLMIIFFLTSDLKTLPQLIFLLLWMAHYIHRATIYPFTQSGRNKPYPLILVTMAVVFNSLNGFINGYGVFHVLKYDIHWLLSWQFITGIIIFISGFIINKTSDEKLRELRKHNPEEYVIPKGWLFTYISCPHYFGEIIEWTGWAIMTWSLPGLAFAVFTFANLFPRGWKSHKWYRDKFSDYPPGRKAIVPFII